MIFKQKKHPRGGNSEVGLSSVREFRKIKNQEKLKKNINL